jgi:aldose 1-epimerase
MMISAQRPTGEQFTIRAGRLTAVVTEVGAGLRSFRRGDRDLVMEFPETEVPPGASGELLMPWPNRVRDGRYTFEGVAQQLDVTEPANANAIHGLSRALPWSVDGKTDSSVRLALRLEPAPGYPHTLDLTAEYSLDEDAGLTISVTAVNAGVSVAPYGIGSHSYLQVDGGLDAGSAVLHLPAGLWTTVDERMIPLCDVAVAGTPYDFREPRSLKGVVLDTAYGELRRNADGNVHVSLGRGAEGVTMWFGAGLEWVQLFTADPLPEPYRRAAVAVEPMSCPPDAFNSGKGLIKLSPGDSVTHTWGITPGAKQ